MAGIGSLPKVNLNELVSQNQAKLVDKTKSADGVETKDFGETISEFIKAVNDDQQNSSQQVSDIITGKSENLHQAMAAMEEAKLSFQLMIEIRTKLLESYQTIQRLQV